MYRFHKPLSDTLKIMIALARTIWTY